MCYPKSAPKSYLKSKLGLLRVIMGLDKSLNQSLQGGEKKINNMNNNGLPRNYCETLEVNLKTCAKWTKWRVYNHFGLD